MAHLNDVIDILDMFVDANLSFPPRDITATARIWASLLGDIPSDVLHQAAIDHIMVGYEFPKLAEIRGLAEKVKSRKGELETGELKSIPDWRTYYQPSNIPLVQFPEDLASKINALETRYDPLKTDALPTDHELNEIALLVRPLIDKIYQPIDAL